MTALRFARPFVNSSRPRRRFQSLGSEAIEKALLLQPALIVTDLSMPLMNGLEETRMLKKLMPAVPIIIYTAHSGPIVEKDGLAAGHPPSFPNRMIWQCSSAKHANCLTESPLDIRGKTRPFSISITLWPPCTKLCLKSG
jgi:CheY-like chemotaxis protein